MRVRKSTWYETKIKYDKMQQNGMLQTVTETYTFEAFSFADAEKKTIEEMAQYISGDYQVTDIKKASYKEVIFSDKEKDDCWYKSKLQFITIDEKTEKEKKKTMYYLVQASDLQQAVRYIDEMMGMLDYRGMATAQTQILDVIEMPA